MSYTEQLARSLDPVHNVLNGLGEGARVLPSERQYIQGDHQSFARFQEYVQETGLHVWIHCPLHYFSCLTLFFERMYARTLGKRTSEHTVAESEDREKEIEKLKRLTTEQAMCKSIFVASFYFDDDDVYWH